MKALAQLLASSTWYAKQRDDFGRDRRRKCLLPRTAKSDRSLRIGRVVIIIEMPPVLETSRDSEIAVRNNPFLYSGCAPCFCGLDSGLLDPAGRARVRTKWPCGSNRYVGSDNVLAGRRWPCGLAEYLDLSGQSPTF